MLDGVILGMIDIQKSAGRVIEPDIISFASCDVAESNSYAGFDSEVIIRNSIRVSEVNIVVVNAC